MTHTLPAALDAASPTTYLIDGILPQFEVSILAGASGAGKSTLVAQALATILNGEFAFFGHAINHPISIAVIGADRSWRSYVELAERVGLDVRLIQHCSIVDDRTVDVNRLEHDSLGLLFDLIKRFEQPAGGLMVVVDPFVTFLGVDANNYSKVAPRLIRVNRFCIDNHITLLGTHHATKARSDYNFKRAQDRVSGSSALLGFTSTQLFLAAPEEIGKPYAEFVSVPHNRPGEVIKLGRDDVGRFVRYNGQGAADAGMLELVLRAVRDKGPLTAPEISQLTHVDPNTLESLLDTLTASDSVRLVGSKFVVPTAS